MAMRVLSKEAAITALRLGKEVYEGKRKFPPEILAKKKEIAEAKKLAYLFIIRTGVVDEGMIDRAVQLMLELDTLYARWAESEAPSMVA